MLISEEYRALNAKKHEESSVFGTQGSKHIGIAIELIGRYKIESVLDYGCGKARFRDSLPEKMRGLIRCYDPCIPEFSARPEVSDLVVCTDVMEHVEPECLENVLADISLLTGRYAYFNISLVEARKTLADGRNAHLIVKPWQWWADKLRNYFTLIEAEHDPKNFSVLCRNKFISLC